jgi:hypothetical protein
MIKEENSMFSKEEYKNFLETQKQYEQEKSKFRDDLDVEKLVYEYIEIHEKYGNLNIATFATFDDPVLCDDHIWVHYDEGEYGCDSISIPIDFLWDSNWQEKEIARLKEEKEQEKVKEEQRKKAYRHKEYEKLKKEYEN